MNVAVCQQMSCHIRFIMKNYIIGIVLALALVMGVVAFAETAEPATDSMPSVSEEAPNEGAASEAPSTEAEKADNNAALQEALGAYRSAQESKYVDDLTEELNGYVKAGTMTQEQVDLILNSVKERLAAKNGECPNCGYQFANGFGRNSDKQSCIPASTSCVLLLL